MSPAGSRADLSVCGGRTRAPAPFGMNKTFALGGLHTPGLHLE